MNIMLVCMLVANGNAAEPYWERCEDAKYVIAQCVKSPSEWWQHLDTSKMTWERVDRNTFCLRIK